VEAVVLEVYYQLSFEAYQSIKNKNYQVLFATGDIRLTKRLRNKVETQLQNISVLFRLFHNIGKYA